MKLLIGQQMVMPALESVRLGKTRNEAAACLTATVLIAPADTYFLKLSVAVGDVVRLLDDGGKEIFLGSVHELDRTPEAVTLTAYDRGVYLTRNELYGVYARDGAENRREDRPGNWAFRWGPWRMTAFTAPSSPGRGSPRSPFCGEPWGRGGRSPSGTGR